MDAPETAGAKTQTVMGNTGEAGAGSLIDRQVGSARVEDSCLRDETGKRKEDARNARLCE